jgi:hypothetical protein
LAGVAAVGGAAALPGSGVLWLTARLLLDGAGALFGLYLLTLLALFLAGFVMRPRQVSSARGQAIGAAAADDAAARPARS